MARLNIPQRFRAPLASIRSLSEESIQEIRSLLDGAQAAFDSSDGDTDSSIDPDKIIHAVRASGPHVDVPGLKDILDAVLSLYVIKAQRDVSVEQLVDDVCDAMEHLDPALSIPRAERADFAGKLLTLLNAEVFALVTKAYDLKTEDERTFCRARILTDLRPIFGANVESGPDAMVVMHTLKIEFHKQASSKEHGEFYVALDADDLRVLKETIERAEAKARTLPSSLKNIHVFGLPKE